MPPTGKVFGACLSWGSFSLWGLSLVRASLSRGSLSLGGLCHLGGGLSLLGASLSGGTLYSISWGLLSVGGLPFLGTSLCWGPFSVGGLSHFGGISLLGGTSPHIRTSRPQCMRCLLPSANRCGQPRKGFGGSGDTTPCRMTGVTLHSHVHYRGISPHTHRPRVRVMLH